MKLMTWPIPALLAWGSSWMFFTIFQAMGIPESIALLGAAVWGGFLSQWGNTFMRKALVVLGFPMSVLVSSSTLSISPWVWLGLVAVVALVYPRKAWRDAPLFPTPKLALNALPDHITLPNDARVLDAGSGLGDGLIALRRAFPRAALHGVEMSWPLRFASALRCPFARIRQGDIWMVDWRSYDLVYMFQRPETMPRAVEKAQAELRRGAWLVSLEFEARELIPDTVIYNKDNRPVWLYQVPFKRPEAAK